MEVVSEYRWSQEQVSLYLHIVLKVIVHMSIMLTALHELPNVLSKQC